MFGYLLGGTSFGFLSFQAYKKRKETKKSEAINAQVSENILSPSEWSEGEDVYSLKSKLVAQELEAQGCLYNRKKYFQRTRSVLSNKYAQFKIRQQLFLGTLYHHIKTPSENNDNISDKPVNSQIDGESVDNITGVSSILSSTIATKPLELQQESPQKYPLRTIQTSNLHFDEANIFSETNNQAENISTQSSSPKTPEKSSNKNSLSGLYHSIMNSYRKKSEDRQIEKIKQQIIQPSGIGRQEGSPTRRVLESPEKQQYTGYSSKSTFQNAIDNYKRYFSESTIGRQSLLYTEYKGQEPRNALKEFLANCQNRIPVNKAMIIHYFYGTAAPSSYVIAVEYKPFENEGVEDTLKESINGIRVAELKKTDAFRYQFNVEQKDQLVLQSWMRSEEESQKKLKEAIENEVESKMNIGGIRQMKYIEVFSLDDSQNVVGYEVQVPYGQNESVYDLRTKTQAADIQYHSSFRQFDVYNPTNSSNNTTTSNNNNNIASNNNDNTKSS